MLTRRQQQMIALGLLAQVGYSVVSVQFLEADSNYRLLNLVSVHEASAYATASLGSDLPTEDTQTPSGLKPLPQAGQWLDGNKIRVALPDSPSDSWTLGSATAQTLSSLLEQATPQLSAAPANANLGQLLSECQQLGSLLTLVEQAAYDGPALQEMRHLHLRATLMQHMNTLQDGALRWIDRDQTGRVIRQQRNQTRKAGQAMQAFLQAVQRVRSDSALQAHYPETAREILALSDRLITLVDGMEVRWETSFYCTAQGRCEQKVLNTRIYAHYPELLAKLSR